MSTALAVRSSTEPGMLLPPQDLLAERGVLGAVLRDNDILATIQETLRSPDDFYRDSHQLIYRTMLALSDEGRAIDPINLADRLTTNGRLEKVGGMDAIFEIVEAGEMSWRSGEHAEIIRSKAILRDLIHAARTIERDAYEAGGTPAEEIAERAETAILRICDDRSTGSAVDMRDALREAIIRIHDRRAGQISGYGTGLKDLDMMTGGLVPGRLIVLAARPAQGKTAMALGIAETVAKILTAQKRAVFFASKEMGAIELAERLLSGRSQVNGNKLRQPLFLSNDELAKVEAAEPQLAELDIIVDDYPGGTVQQLAAEARRHKSRRNIGLVVVDYIQLLEGGESARESRQEQVAKISRRLKTLARELDVPVLALSQLNRGVEAREDRTPRMSDLRDSGAIEQDADQVILIHRPEYYDPNDRPGLTLAIVAKNRHGATGEASLIFDRPTTTFRSYGAGYSDDWHNPTDDIVVRETQQEAF